MNHDKLFPVASCSTCHSHIVTMKRAFSALVAAVMVLISCSGAKSEDKPELRIAITRADWPHLRVSITNLAKSEVTLWAPSVSWGWYGLTFALSEEHPSVVIRRKPISFTLNVPLVETIKPGRTTYHEVNLADNFWSLPEEVKHKAGSFKISAKLKFDASDESIANGVLVGAWVSEPVRIEIKP